MYRLFIVDDEPYVRKGLREFFDWSKYGIEVIGEAEDGESALEAISQLKPDIVLTDVKMPYMDGMQLAQKLRERFQNIKIIFVSGHDDLEYLKSALKVDAIDYILKSVDLDELDAVIKKVIHIIRQEEQQKDLITSMNQKLNQSMPLLKEKFFLTLIIDEIKDTKYLENKIRFLGLELPVEANFCLLVIKCDHYFSLFENQDEKDRQLNSFAVLNICQELIKEYFTGYSFESRQGEFVCILALEEDYEGNLLALAGKIKENLKGYLNLSVTIGMGEIVSNLRHIRHSYGKALEALNQKYMGKNQIIKMDSLEFTAGDTCNFDFHNVEILFSFLKASDEDKVTEMLDEIFKSLCVSKNIKYIRNVCIQILLIPSRLLTEFEIDAPGDLKDESYLCQQLFRLETVDGMFDFILVHYKTVCRIISEKRIKKSSNVVERIKNIIHERYNEDITVSDIAKEVYLTHTYICLIFKQETGETVNDYVTKVRMEKAKEMLQDPRYKLYDICYAVGYTAPSYFTRLFKKYTGFNPSEFREKVMKK